MLAPPVTLGKILSDNRDASNKCHVDFFNVDWEPLEIPASPLLAYLQDLQSG